MSSNGGPQHPAFTLDIKYDPMQTLSKNITCPYLITKNVSIIHDVVVSCFTLTLRCCCCSVSIRVCEHTLLRVTKDVAFPAFKIEDKTGIFSPRIWIKLYFYVKFLRKVFNAILSLLNHNTHNTNIYKNNLVLNWVTCF